MSKIKPYLLGIAGMRRPTIEICITYCFALVGSWCLC